MRAKFATVAAEEGGDYAAQLVAHVDGERAVDRPHHRRAARPQRPYWRPSAAFDYRALLIGA
ncbi:hypothetical protein [Amycolatopsis sp. DG1A-15b]|uniref:hypothetical protein n=1 Tax=Amycolatopsis sp. DG1A-15b TaxID=3052846 RepID=UPI00255B923D|nr:hypothetical protein [Amycolatopsis sp. DG1A-15b]WIX85030.1 hypothetical protein QRY02_27770 [Amycolatopsis sp. DG1A-15b]